MATKADKATKEQRVEAVYRLLIDGWTNPRIVENIVKTWKLKPSTAYYYIGLAWERIKETAAPERQEHLSRAIAAHYQMLSDAKTVKEKAIVWKALRELLGLDEPKAVELSGKDGGPVVIQMTWGDTDAGDGNTHDGAA